MVGSEMPEKLPALVDTVQLRALHEELEDGSMSLGRLLARYTDGLPARLERLREAGERRDSVALGEAARALRASSGTIGARRSEHLAGEIESFAERDELEPALARVAALRATIAATSAELETAVAGLGAASPPATPPVVLVADDDAEILALVAYCLEKARYKVIRATDGEEALELAFEHHPDVCVLDLKMPKLDGRAVTRTLRRHPETERAQVLLLTASVRDVDVMRGFEAGADDYLKKPFTPQDLRGCVAAALARA
jgi:CheY-like chemotaxis protein